MKKEKRYSCVVICLVVSCASCHSEPITYGVAGVEEKFCVPEIHELGTTFWMPIAKSEYLDGFVLKGCWGQGGESDECVLPKVVMNVSIGSAANFVSQDYDEIPHDAFYRRLPQEEGTSIEVLDDGARVVIYNKQLSNLWFVWDKEKKTTHEGIAALGSGDVLAARCEEKEVIENGKSRSAIFCTRSVLSGDYSIEYSFESKDRVPAGLGRLDSEIYATVNGWRCLRKA